MKISIPEDERAFIRVHNKDRDRYNKHCQRLGLQQHQLMFKLMDVLDGKTSIATLMETEEVAA